MGKSGRFTCLPCGREYKRLHPQKNRADYFKQYKQKNSQKVKEYFKQYNATVRKIAKESDANRMSYRGTDVRLTRKRTGVCNLCRAVAKIDCYYTNFHHAFYDDNNPEAGIMELCRRCHNIESLELKHIQRNKVNGRFE